MRGEAEQYCFDIVKQYLDKDVYFAMSFDDKENVKKAFDKATPNPKLSEFPDFIFDKGFIEHFQVTSSFENRKGSTMERERSGIERDYQRKEQEVLSNASDGQIEIHSISTDPYWHESHSYEKFIKSFKNKFEKHLKSLDKYDGVKDYKIFMIEYSDSTLRMSKKVPEDLMFEVSYGDLLVRENPTYRLSRDSELLRYIYGMRDKIDYVIFVNDGILGDTYVDVINTKNALEITKLLYDGYEFHCAMTGSSKVGITVSVPSIEGDNDQ